MYAVIHTHSDIFFALDWLSQYFNDSAEHHEHALKKLLQYICSTVNLEIMYRLSESQNLIEYSNSDYTSDKQNWKSVLDHVYMLEKESILWVSWKQKSVMTSITEIEYMIMFMCIKTEVWLIQILRNMRLDKYLDSNSYCVSIQENETHKKISSLQLRDDNQTVLTLIKNAHVHERSKHIDVVYHHIQNLHQRNQIKINFMFSWDIIADDLTKSLSRQNFKNFVNQLRLVSVTVWLVVHVMFIEHEHRFLEHEYRFIKLHVVLLLTRTLKNSCSNLGHVTCTAEFSLTHLHTLLPSLCLILYVSNTKYSMVFQSISVLLYLDITRHCIYI